MKIDNRLKYGATNIVNNKLMILILFVAIGIEYILLYQYQAYLIRQNYRLLSYSLNELFNIMFIILYILLPLMTLLVMCTPIDAGEHRKAFESIGLHNYKKETPELMACVKNGKRYRYIYSTNGVSLKQVNDFKEKIESALNLNIISIEQGKDNNTFEIVARSGDERLPDSIDWSDKYIDKDGIISLGVTLDGIKKIDLNISNHVQIGGSTGSGKTILLKNILYQLKKQGHCILLADYKGGVDFTREEKESYKYVTDKQQTMHVLDSVVAELDNRKDIFNKYEVENISAYNKKFPTNPLQRIVFATDECAFLFQKKGLEKEEKEIQTRIEKDLEYIAQQGRAFGCNLVLSTQRGDSETIPAQIRSNLTTRICGRANEILSKLTIDNSLAAEIKPEEKGRFVDDQGEFFQAFKFES